MTDNIHPVFDRIYDRKVKEEILRQKARVIWFTGLSGSGKTTLAANLEKELFFRRFFCQVLDGDNIRAASDPRNRGQSRVIEFAAQASE